MAFEELPTPPGYAPIPGVAIPDDTPGYDTPSAQQVTNNLSDAGVSPRGAFRQMENAVYL